MLGLLIFFTSLLFGWVLVRSLPMRFYKAEALAGGMLLGLFLSSWLYGLLSWILSYQISVPVATALMLATVILVGREKRLQPAVLEKKWLPNKKALGWWLVITLTSGTLLGWLFYTHMLRIEPDGWYSVGGSWGDLALHISLITHFANQAKFGFDFPLLSGAHLTYPFLIDFFSSLLYRSGWNLQLSLLVPGFVLALSFVQLLFFISFRLFKQGSAAALTVILFLGNGSVAGVWYAWLDFRASHQTLWFFLIHLPKEYSQLAEQNLQFTNSISGALLPQRSILFGLGIFCWVCLLLIQVHQNEMNRRHRAVVFGWVGILLGLLPFAHPHTFLVLIFLLAWLVIGIAVGRRNTLLAGYYLGAIALALTLAVPQLHWQAQNYSPTFSKWYFGWVCQPEENGLLFWLRTWGLELPLLFAAPFLLYYSRTYRYLIYVLMPFLLIFIALNVYIFQPYTYDNIKLLWYVHIVFSMVIGYFLVRWAARSKLALVGVMVIVISLTATGALALVQQSTVSWQLFSTDDIAFANYARQEIPKDAVVLTGGQHNQPIPTLTGRSIVMGYAGWLWSYGLDYSAQQRDVAIMYQGGLSSWELLNKYKVAYIVIGPPERSSLVVNENYFASHYPLVIHYKNWEVYQVGFAN